MKQTDQWKLPLFDDQDDFDPIQTPLNLISIALERAVTEMAESLTPVGTITAYGSPLAPAGHLLCDGASYNKSDYPALFAVIGQRFGGSGTTFAVPNTRSRVLVGVQGDTTDMKTVGQMGGEKFHKMTTAEMPAHTHGYSWGRAAASAGVGAMYADGFDVGRQSDSAGSGTPFNVVQPYTTVNYIIKHGA